MTKAMLAGRWQAQSLAGQKRNRRKYGTRRLWMTGAMLQITQEMLFSKTV